MPAPILQPMAPTFLFPKPIEGHTKMKWLQNRFATASVFSLVTSIFVGFSAPTSAAPSELAPKIVHSIRGGISDQGLASRTSGSGSNGINYNGGPIMLGTTNIYYIWYGNWANNTAPTILEYMARYIGGSPYLNINTTYYDSAKRYISNSAMFAASITDSYSLGTALSDANIQTIVLNAINGTDTVHQSGKLPYDVNGIYFVLTSADVTATSGFCTSYCGWHTYTATTSGNIKYAFVGNPDRCPSACAAQTTSPNNNPGADGMASIIAHELEETMTDPLLNAWYDRRGSENADKCAWTFGTTMLAPNGSKYNMTLAGMEFLIQRNWVNAAGGYCALSY